MYLENTNDPLMKEVNHFVACTTPNKTILHYKQGGPKYRDNIISVTKAVLKVPAIADHIFFFFFKNSVAFIKYVFMYNQLMH